MPEDCPRLVSYMLGVPSPENVTTIRERLLAAGATVRNDETGIVTQDGDGMTVVVCAESARRSPPPHPEAR